MNKRSSDSKFDEILSTTNAELACFGLVGVIAVGILVFFIQKFL